jgi:hypothetical protein
MISPTISQSFRKRADSAAYWEAWVGMTLTRAGFGVVLHPFKYDDGKDHGHTWDLDVLRGTHDNAAEITQVEVKSLSLSFTSPKSFPFKDPFVCSQNSFLRKWPGKTSTQRDFMFVSTETGAIVWLPAFSTVSLNHETIDRTRGEIYKTVRCKRDQLRTLHDFVEKVKSNET